jgi:hypothetical protein
LTTCLAGAHLVYPGLDGAQVDADRYLKITGLAGKYLRNANQAPAKTQPDKKI